MITDRDDAFPYNVTTADRQAAQLAMSNPDSQPLMVYSESGPVVPPAPRQPISVGWFTFALLLVGFFIFIKVKFGDWESSIPTHRFHLTWPFCVGLVIALVGLAGIWFLFRRARSGTTHKPIVTHFLVTEPGLVIHHPHLREFKAWRQYKDYRDSGEVLVVFSESPAIQIILPLHDVPPDRREEFRRHLQKAFGGKPQ